MERNTAVNELRFKATKEYKPRVKKIFYQTNPHAKKRWDKIHGNLICVFYAYIVQLRAPSNNQVALSASTCIRWPNGENVAPTELDQTDRKCTQVKPNGVRQDPRRIF